MENNFVIILDNTLDNTWNKSLLRVSILSPRFYFKIWVDLCQYFILFY